MSDFARLQGAFQRAIVEGDDAVLGEILDSPQETRAVLFGVYRDAYVLRLVEALGNENEVLATHLGEEAFEAMARAYLAAYPSRNPNLRWFGRALPEFLAATEPHRAEPVLAEIAALEGALSEAFDASDAPDFSAAELSEVAPESWKDLVFLQQPHARRLDLATNAFAIWSALSDGETPPTVETTSEPQRLIVWRQDEMSMVLPLGIEEAMLWDEAGAGIPFGTLCEMAATYDDPDNAAMRVAGYLQGWIAAGMLTGFQLSRKGGD